MKVPFYPPPSQTAPWSRPRWRIIGPLAWKGRIPSLYLPLRSPTIKGSGSFFFRRRLYIIGFPASKARSPEDTPTMTRDVDTRFILCTVVLMAALLA
ncbi:MAG: hypothetical protein AAB223_01690, partial [Pseudomonadota bacterium]